MRVLQVMAGARHGGAEAFFTRLVPALARAGLEQRAVIRAYPERVATLAAAGVEAVHAPFGGPLELGTLGRLRQAIAGFAPHVVLSWMNRATAACPRGRFVHVARLGGYYNPKYYRACDHLIANTEDIAAYLRGAGFPPERVHVVPNFVDDAPAPPLPRADLDTPADAPLLVALGRLHRNKAFDVLLDALARLPDAWLWLAGEGPERAALESQARRLGLAPRLRLLGWRDDVPALIGAADILVCPSRHEPLGNVVLEGFARGVPVVAAASQGPGALIETGRTGVLAPVDDVDALAGALRGLLDDRPAAAALAQAGRRTFEQHFTEAAVVRRCLTLFAAITGDAA